MTKGIMPYITAIYEWLEKIYHSETTRHLVEPYDTPRYWELKQELDSLISRARKLATIMENTSYDIEAAVASLKGERERRKQIEESVKPKLEPKVRAAKVMKIKYLSRRTK